MAVAKYRPTFTMAEINALINSIEAMKNYAESEQPIELDSALQTLKMFKFKAELGINKPASITTGSKPGPASKLDIIKQDAEEDIAKKLKEMPYAQALTAAETYKQLGIEVPADIQIILNAHTEEK